MPCFAAAVATELRRDTTRAHKRRRVYRYTRVYRYKHVVMRRDTELQPDVLRREDLHVSTHNTRVHTATSIHVVMRRVTVLTRAHKRRYTPVYMFL